MNQGFRSSKSKKTYAPEILIIDDEEDIRELMGEILRDEGYIVRFANDGLSAIQSIYAKEPNVIVLDVWLKGSELDGIGILEQVKETEPYIDIPVIMISGHGNIDTAIKSLRKGAYDYIEKPFTEDRLKLVVKRAIESRNLRRENDELKACYQEEEIVGDSHHAKNLRFMIDKAAASSSRVLITGPHGVGKEVVAKLIHKQSKLCDMPFIQLRPLMLSENSNYLSNIFGSEDNSSMIYCNLPPKIGIIEQANGGTLFIDEIWSITYEAQLKILKLLQENKIYREGGKAPIDVNVRIIASSSRNLEEEVRMKRFREDLYYRLNVLPIRIEALRERTSDIPKLCEYFMKNICNTTGLPYREISNETLITMQSYDWPGNLRQLKNIIEWLLIMAPMGEIKSSDLPIDIRSSSPISDSLTSRVASLPLKEAREEFEKQYLKAQLTRFNGNISRTAEFIGMERSALHRKLKFLGLSGSYA